MDDFSDSGGSSSTGSRTTKHTISAEVVALGEKPVIPSTLKQFMLSLPAQLLPALALTIEFVYVGRYCGMVNSSLYAFTYPFVQILTKNIPMSLAQSCANYAYKNITAGQYAAANIYFAYYFIAAAVYALVVLILCFAALSPQYATAGSKVYYICYFAIFPFIEVFTFAVDKFYEVENRIGLVFVKQLISAFTVIGFNPFILNYMNGGDMTVILGLDAIAYARCVDYAIQFVWNIVVIGRMKVLDVEYFGVLKFSTRRLKPFRPRFLLSVYTNALASILINNVFALCILVLTFILKYIPTTDYELDLLYFKNQLVIIVEELIMSIHAAFNKSFYLIASYNIGIKKLSRVSQFFKWHIIFDFVFAVPVAIAFFAAAKPLTSALIPDIKIFTRSKPHEIDSSYNCVQFTAVAAVFGFLMQLSNSLLEIEQQIKFSCILQIPALVYVVASPFIALQIIGETAPLALILALIEAVNASIGIPLVIYFSDRYKYLAKAEEIKMKYIEEQTKKAGEVDEIRLTVSQAFERDVEEEDARTAKLKTRMSQEVRLSMTTREKADKLSNSMAFQSLARQFGSSVDRFGGSVLRRSTAAFDDMRASQMRTSEAADK